MASLPSSLQTPPPVSKPQQRLYRPFSFRMDEIVTHAKDNIDPWQADTNRTPTSKRPLQASRVLAADASPPQTPACGSAILNATTALPHQEACSKETYFPPVKNTFIHFATSVSPLRAAKGRKCSSPNSEPQNFRPCSSGQNAESDDRAAEASAADHMNNAGLDSAVTRLQAAKNSSADGGHRSTRPLRLCLSDVLPCSSHTTSAPPSSPAALHPVLRLSEHLLPESTQVFTSQFAPSPTLGLFPSGAVHSSTPPALHIQPCQLSFSGLFLGRPTI